MTNQNNFWALLDSSSQPNIVKHIEIPAIQRDYAQGRDNPTANRIIDSFLKAIISALENDEPLHLDFIYGKEYQLGESDQAEAELDGLKDIFSALNQYVETLGHKTTIDITKVLSESAHNQKVLSYFIPLDGQQRLTTLFLLHWYLLYRIEESEAKFKTLARFTYKTRASSHDFIQFICSEDTQETLRDLKESSAQSSLENIAPITKMNDLKKSTVSLARKIQFLPAFFSEWKYDPTVKGMLAVLNRLDEQLKDKPEEELKDFWERLTRSKDPVIYFDYLNLKDLDQTDELYVKMNARGKQLSDWENFKVWLIEQFSDNFDIEEDELTKISIKLDIEWHDIFWNARLDNKKIDSVGSAYLQFFKLQFLFIYLKTIDEKSIDPNIVNILRAREEGDFIEILESYFAKKPETKTEYFKIIQTILDRLEASKGLKELNEKVDSTYQLYIKSAQVENFVQYFFSKQSLDINLWDTAFLYVITERIEKSTADQRLDELELERYSQILGNLIYNTTIEENLALAKAIKSIDLIIEALCDRDKHSSINNYVASDDFSKIPFFSGAQKEEEKRKAEMVIDNPEWLPVFTKAEQTPYFYGQIGFIIDYLSSKSKLTIDAFNFYSERLAFLFSSEILNHPKELFQRALLTKGDYTLRSGSNRTFIQNDYGTLSLRNRNWRKLFKDKDKLGYLMALVEDPRLSVENIEEALKQIITIYIGKLREEDNIESLDLIVLEPELIKLCWKREFRVWDKNIYLLNSTRISGWYWELYSYYLKLQLEREYSEKISYIESKGSSDRKPHIQLKINDRVITIERNYKSGEFVVKDETESNKPKELKSFPDDKSLTLYQEISKYIKYLIGKLNYDG